MEEQRQERVAAYRLMLSLSAPEVAPMGTDDKQRQFEQIVARLTADYPSLAGRRRWSRRVLTTAAVLGGLLWGLLSVAMVAWGRAGVVLTCAVIAVLGAVAAVDTYRRRHR
jgi:hypothetical protein